MRYEPHVFPGIEVTQEQCVSMTVRKRSFRVPKLEDVADLLRSLKLEGFVGYVVIRLGPGTVPQSVESEERLKT